jgi:hypothetical protein
MFKRNSIVPILAASAALATLATPAVAQQAGSYAGTSADGSYVSLTVTESGGVFTITGMNVNMLAACKHTGNTANEGWGFYVGTQVVDHFANFVSGNDYYYTTGNITWPSKNKAVGRIESWTATFTSSARPPTDSQFCISKDQKFTLTFQGAADVSAAAPGSAVAFQKPANATSRFGAQPQR